jgi:excisionase family DNA binding protein
MYFKDELVTQAQLAEKLSVSKQTVWRMLGKGQLPPMITIGSRSKRWHAEDINEWLQSLKNN